MLVERLAECLAYTERYAPKYDAVSLRTRPELPQDWRSWDEPLSRAPAAIIHRSEALRQAARVLTNDFSGMPEIAELDRFFHTRRQLLGQNPGEWAVAFARRELARPRALLIVDPDASLSDGAARVASSGYIDDNNIPPWDTWLIVMPPPPNSSGSPCLLCWVPEWAAGLVDAGIVVNPEQCLSWTAPLSGRDVG